MDEQPTELTPEQIRRIEKSYLKQIEKVGKQDVPQLLTKETKIRRKAMELVEQPGTLLKLGRQILLLFEMIRDWWLGAHQLPWKTAAAALAALLYFINPFDLVPDVLPIIGYLDDAVVVGACFRLVRSDLKTYAKAKSIDADRYGL